MTAATPEENFDSVWLLFLIEHFNSVSLCFLKMILGNKHNEVSFPHEALSVSVSPPVLRKKIQREPFGQYDHTGRLKKMGSETDT